MHSEKSAIEATAAHIHALVHEGWDAHPELSAELTYAFSEIGKLVPEAKRSFQRYVMQAPELQPLAMAAAYTLGAMKQHSMETYLHIVRMTALTLLLAKESGITDEPSLGMLCAAGLLHDSGKLFIPAELLNKSAVHNLEEQAYMKLHVVFSKMLYDQMHVSASHAWIGETIATHHERMDGNGYPRGLLGKDILPTGRLIRVADMFEAMTGMRAYREPMTMNQAIALLRNDSISADLHFLGLAVDRGVLDAFAQEFLPGQSRFPKPSACMR